MTKIILINTCADCPNYMWDQGQEDHYCFLTGKFLYDETNIPSHCLLEDETEVSKEQSS